MVLFSAKHYEILLDTLNTFVKFSLKFQFLSPCVGKITLTSKIPILFIQALLNGSAYCSITSVDQSNLWNQIFCNELFPIVITKSQSKNTKANIFPELVYLNRHTLNLQSRFILI